MKMNPSFVQEENERIIRVYHEYERAGVHTPTFFVFRDPSVVFRIHERYYATMCLLKMMGYYPLDHLRILDVGCADGMMLRQFVQWGAAPENLAGIELRSGPVELSRKLNPAIDLRCGSGTDLPWPDSSFDLVCQNTMFSSIRNLEVTRHVALSMSRVLKPGGAVLWYDMAYDNPRNPEVRGIKPAEIRALFPDFRVHLQRISLAPPLARRLPHRLMPVLYPLLATIPFLRSHYLGLLVKAR